MVRRARDVSDERRVSLGHEWDELIARIRELTGFRDFLRPPRLAGLLSAAAGGPVVMLNISRWRCDALLVTMTGVETVPFRSVTAQDVVDRTHAYLRSVIAAQEATDEFWRHKRHFASGDRSAAAFREFHRARSAVVAARRTMEQTLDVTLRWLWDAIAEPVLRALALLEPHTGGTPLPRMWWCPTGPLTVLPLHAAGHHEAGGCGARGTGDRVVDHVVSSYTPTLQALLPPDRDTDTIRGPAPEDRMLVVAPEPGGVSLPSAVAERELLRTLFPGTRGTLLTGPDATPGRVLDEMERHRWVHFICHGDQYFADPSQGGLMVHGGRVTVVDIGAHLREGVFAFVPACKSATGGTLLADEMISVAAALRYSGYRHVLATLWSVDDSAAERVVREVYTELTVTGEFVPDRCAYALHRVVRRLCDEPYGRPSLWAPFVHIGP